MVFICTILCGKTSDQSNAKFFRNLPKMLKRCIIFIIIKNVFPFLQCIRLGKLVRFNLFTGTCAHSEVLWMLLQF